MEDCFELWQWQQASDKHPHSLDTVQRDKKVKTNLKHHL